MKSSWFQSFLLFSYVSAIPIMDPDFEQGKKYLFFVTNNAGLFSQFLQTRAMYKKAREVGYNLVLSPTKSKHYDNTIVNMCDIFDLPSDILCKYPPTGIPCLEKWPNEVYFTSKANAFCYSGSITFKNDNMAARKYILDAVDYNRLKLEFSDWALKYWKEFKSSFRAIIKARGYDARSPYTAVHWRRGDQLISRCQDHSDVSVNCENAEKLVELVKQTVKDDSNVYIATNERSVAELNVLQEAGFLTYDSVATKRNVSIFRGGSAPNNIQILAIETKMMLNAKTFLAWGISEIDDTVESVRAQTNLSHCAGVTRKASTAKQDTWCSRLRARLPADPTTPLLPTTTTTTTSSSSASSTNSAPSSGAAKKRKWRADGAKIENNSAVSLEQAESTALRGSNTRSGDLFTERVSAVLRSHSLNLRNATWRAVHQNSSFLELLRYYLLSQQRQRLFE